MNKNIIGKLSVLCVIGLSLSACGSKPDNTQAVTTTNDEVSRLESAMNELQNKYEELRERKPSEAINWATEDLKSIGDWEYKVIELSGLSAQDLEKELNELGKDRWQVFWLNESKGNTQVMLKRPTVSYLSKLPLSSLGKMMLNGEGQ